MRSSADSIFFLNARCPRIHALNLFGAGTKRDPEVTLVISQTEGCLLGSHSVDFGNGELETEKGPNSALNKSNLKGQMAQIHPGTNETISI